MAGCRTKWWRCATVPWAGVSLALRATAAKTAARRTFRNKPSTGRERRRCRLRKAAASNASIARCWKPGARTRRGPFTCSTSAIPPNTRPAMSPARFRRRAGNLCRRQTNMSVRSAPASWLRQMGWKDVFVLAEAGAEKGQPKTATLDGEAPSGGTIDCAALAALLSRNAATVVDLAPSRDYVAGHIPGAWFAIRTRLERALKKIPLGKTLILTSEDGALARLASAEAEALVDIPVRVLAGGNAAWRAAGYALSTEACMADEAVDQWRKPYERSGDTKAAMNEYLAWEIDLLPRIARDGSLKFFSH